LVRRVLADAGWSARALDVVAVSIGPGSFTGLRVGVGLAKGLAYAGGARVVPVPTLDALAAVAGGEPGELVCAMLDARKGEVYARLYRVGRDGEPAPVTMALLTPPDALLGGVEGRCRFVGDGVDAYRPVIERACGREAVILPFSSCHPRGSVVARLAGGLATLGADALGALEPCYVRPASVQVDRTPRVDNKRGTVLRYPARAARGGTPDEGMRCMEKDDEQLILSLLDTDAELRRYYDEHLELERQIEGFQQKLYLTSDEEFQKKRLQKLKLAGKDKIMEILARYRSN
jgi:tRNA threonylcarbamoyladenosine biosynthesis protein TsaB